MPLPNQENPYYWLKNLNKNHTIHSFICRGFSTQRSLRRYILLQFRNSLPRSGR